MKNVSELTTELIALYEQTRDGIIELATAKELANVAGKILKAESLQLSYNEFMKYADKKIDFLETKK